MQNRTAFPGSSLPTGSQPQVYAPVPVNQRRRLRQRLGSPAALIPLICLALLSCQITNIVKVPQLPFIGASPTPSQQPTNPVVEDPDVSKAKQLVTTLWANAGCQMRISSTSKELGSPADNLNGISSKVTVSLSYFEKYQNQWIDWFDIVIIRNGVAELSPASMAPLSCR